MRYLLVPSCEVVAKNRLDGMMTEKRLMRALSLWQSGKYDAIVVMGGIYLPADTQTIASSLLMRSWLNEQGVHANKILCEELSRDTYENISGVLRLVERDHDQHFTVVTHWQHALRFWVTFRLAHHRKVKLVPMRYWIGFKAFCLEWAMLLVHVFDPKGTGRIATENREKRTY
ncbi:MAG: hypothetical protein UT32_C0011G0016 [Parcubacteria group bacterium GW2011_GWC2_39_14]|nr:MAG: hypothetical protein UT32_C0011G0016 [Parcubacteria group bacterium GW2011_GWC2_39_14]KKR55052.1 MAG: hypothetical protein UT91_C0005G0053 [Parcubacteria group bacterium GW2011_GWA2_40_23]